MSRFTAASVAAPWRKMPQLVLAYAAMWVIGTATLIVVRIAFQPEVPASPIQPSAQTTPLNREERWTPNEMDSAPANAISNFDASRLPHEGEKPPASGVANRDMGYGKYIDQQIPVGSPDISYGSAAANPYTVKGSLTPSDSATWRWQVESILDAQRISPYSGAEITQEYTQEKYHAPLNGVRKSPD